MRTYYCPLALTIIIRGCNSAVECLLPKQNVVGSSPITRSLSSFTHTKISCFQKQRSGYILVCSQTSCVSSKDHPHKLDNSIRPIVMYR